MLACAYPGAELSWSTDAGDALAGASYVIACGGAPRKKGMTREDLLLTNCPVARRLGQDIRRYCADVEYVIVVFNPADIAGLTVLVHSGLKPACVSTLAALDSTRLRAALAGYFSVGADSVTGCATYGGHGEKMVVFASGIAIDGVPLTKILDGAPVNGRGMSCDDWRAIQAAVRAAGSRIITLRGRPSFQSPAHQSVEMLRARIACADYPWPCGAYFADGPFARVMMAAPVRFSVFGMQLMEPEGDEDEMEALRESYAHLCRLRDETIGAAMLPPVGEWKRVNPNL